MADLSTLARPYAKAAFDYAKEHNGVADWQHYLQIVTNIVQDKSFQEYLHNPAIAAPKKVAAIQDIYRHSQPRLEQDSTVFANILTAIDNSQMPSNNVQRTDLSSDFMNFLTQLSEQDRLALLPSVRDRFEVLQANDAKQIHALVTSAYPLTPEQTQLIQSRLSTSVGSNVILDTQIDPSLMAGVTIKIGDKLLDDSVRGKLKQLKTQLTA